MAYHVLALVFHVAQAMILPLVGMALGMLARRALGSARHSANVLWALSLACSWIGLSCWPNPSSALLDTTTHIPGLGHLVTDTLITAAFVFQFAFTCTVGGVWTRKRLGLIGLYVALVGLYIVEWAVVHTQYDFYKGYSGSPFPVLAINLTLVALIEYAAGLGIWGYARYVHGDAHSSERVVALSAMTVFGLAGFYGFLVLGQTVMASRGLGSTAVLSLTGPLMGMAGSTALVVIWLLTGKWSRRLRAYAQAVFAMHQRAVELNERERVIDAREQQLTERAGDIVDLAVWVEDQLVQVHAEVDARPLAEVAAWCAAGSQTPYQRKVALTTTRLALLGRARVLRLPRYDLSLLSHEDDPDSASGVYDLSREVEDYQNFLSDVLRELQLADPRTLPVGMEPRDEPPGWRRDAAAVIVQALQRYGHAYQRQPA